MKQIIISSETPEAKALEKGEDKSAAASVKPVISSPFLFFLILWHKIVTDFRDLTEFSDFLGT